MISHSKRATVEDLHTWRPTLAQKLIAPWRHLTRPVFDGLDRIPTDRPLLFVGNHTILGLVDVPIFYAELYAKRGIALRSLGDHVHFRIPFWGSLLERFGAVDGTPENCDALMRAKEPILVFPGGAREVAKRRGEKYQLIWKERIGFARMSIRHGYTIVPFGAVGAEESVDIVADAHDLNALPFGRIARMLGLRDDAMIPLVRGIGLTPLPRPERLYFGIGEPIDAAEYGGDESVESCRKLRDRTRSAVASEIARLRTKQETDPERREGEKELARWAMRASVSLASIAALATGFRMRSKNG